MGYTPNFSAVIMRWPVFAEAAMTTLALSSIAIVFGFLLGVALAIARRSQMRILAIGATSYTEFVRNTPLLVQLFVVFFGLASLGISLTAYSVAAVALTLNVAAYSSEIVRAGLDSIQRGQVEAGECLGLSRLQLYRYVLLFPALERVYPALTSQFILILLGSSVVSQISVNELTAAANNIQSLTYRSLETYLVLALCYVVLAIFLRAIFVAIGWIVFPRTRFRFA